METRPISRSAQDNALYANIGRRGAILSQRIQMLSPVTPRCCMKRLEVLLLGVLAKNLRLYCTSTKRHRAFTIDQLVNGSSMILGLHSETSP